MKNVAPIAVGTSEISVGGKLREVMIAGTTAQYVQVRRLDMAQGRFLRGRLATRRQRGVIGAKVREEMFGNEPALGQLVRVGRPPLPRRWRAGLERARDWA